MENIPYEYYLKLWINDLIPIATLPFRYLLHWFDTNVSLVGYVGCVILLICYITIIKDHKSGTLKECVKLILGGSVICGALVAFQSGAIPALLSIVAVPAGLLAGAFAFAGTFLPFVILYGVYRLIASNAFVSAVVIAILGCGAIYGFIAYRDVIEETIASLAMLVMFFGGLAFVAWQDNREEAIAEARGRRTLFGRQVSREEAKDSMNYK